MKQKNSSNPLFETYLSHELHVGGINKNLNLATKPFLEEVADNVCVFNLSHTFMALSRIRKYLFELQRYNKKILFVGAPKNLEKEFSSFCAKYKHYCIQTWFYALFRNFSKAYQTKRKTLLHVKERPSLIFIFDLEKYSDVVKEAKCLQIPIMAFASSDDTIENIDYVIPGNGKSEKGGLFIFNFFAEVFLQAKQAQIERQKEIEAVKEKRRRQAEKLKKERELAKQRFLEKRKKRELAKQRALEKKKNWELDKQRYLQTKPQREEKSQKHFFSKDSTFPRKKTSFHESNQSATSFQKKGIIVNFRKPSQKKREGEEKNSIFKRKGK
jgi:ribosomal protein S2